jgi:hemolysin III
MPWLLTQRDAYSPAETRLDAAVHVAGLVAVGFGVPVLLGLAVMATVQGGDTRLLWATAVYALAFAAMIGASALFNLTGGAPLAWLYQRLDHSAIYLKIAGTYTPLTVMTGQGGAFVAGLWLAASAGIALKLYSPVRFRPLAIALYLSMGWAGVLILPKLWVSLPAGSLALIVAGGILYTVGVGFYLFNRLRYHYVIWHVCVLFASILLYVAVLSVVAQGWMIAQRL